MREERMEPYEDSAISPSKGIGPFSVGMSERDLFQLIPANLAKRKTGSSYSIRCGSFTIWVDGGSRKVTQIGVSLGFKGKLLGAVGIGSAVKEAENFLGPLFVDEDFQLRVPGLPGVCFQTNPVVNELAPTPRQDARIDGIYVFGAEDA